MNQFSSRNRVAAALLRSSSNIGSKAQCEVGSECCKTCFKRPCVKGFFVASSVVIFIGAILIGFCVTVVSYD